MDFVIRESDPVVLLADHVVLLARVADPVALLARVVDPVVLLARVADPVVLLARVADPVVLLARGSDSMTLLTIVPYLVVHTLYFMDKHCAYKVDLLSAR